MLYHEREWWLSYSDAGTPLSVNVSGIWACQFYVYFDVFTEKWTALAGAARSLEADLRGEQRRSCYARSHSKYVIADLVLVPYLFPPTFTGSHNSRVIL